MISDFYEDFENDSTPKLRPVKRPSPVKCEYISQDVVFPAIIQRCLKRDIGAFISHPIVPIENIDGYIRGKGIAPKDEMQFRKLYTPELYEEPEKLEKINVPSDPLHVFTKVLKNGQIKETVPMEVVYNYEKKGHVAPLDIRIKAAKAFGYPDEILTKMIQHHDREKIVKPKLEEFIDAIFGKSVIAKVSKPKSKTTHESLNSKFKKKPLKKY